jgi:hypothetical protein
MDPFPGPCWGRVQSTVEAMREHRVNGFIEVRLNLGKGQVLGWSIQVGEHSGVAICLATSSS